MFLLQMVFCFSNINETTLSSILKDSTQNNNNNNIASLTLFLLVSFVRHEID